MAIFKEPATLVAADLSEQFESIPRGPWPRSPNSAAVVPFIHQAHAAPAGFLIAGLNPYRPFDVAYRGFLELLAGQIAAALASCAGLRGGAKRAEALAEIDRAKTAFFSNISHEFRTPLTLMLSPLEDLVRDLRRGDAGRARRRTGVIATAMGVRLLKLVNTLARFFPHRGGPGRRRPIEPVDLALLHGGPCEHFPFGDGESGPSDFIVDCPPLPEPVYVDRDMWEKIVLNLISNAFKFTLDGEIRSAPGDGGWPSHGMTGARQRGSAFRIRCTAAPVRAISSRAEAPRPHPRRHRHRPRPGPRTCATARRRVDAQSDLGRGQHLTVSHPTGIAHLPPERFKPAASLTPLASTPSAYVEEALALAAGSSEIRNRSLLLATECPATSTGAGDRPPSSSPTITPTCATISLVSSRHDIGSIAVADGQAALEAARAGQARSRPDRCHDAAPGRL